MKRYRVTVPEVHYQDVIIEADSPDQARDLVAEGGGDYCDNTLTYSHTLDADIHNWTVREED